MILNKIQLQNFGAIKEGTLNFQKGFNLIMGNIGQGKSHIIHSIAYLLLNALKENRVDNFLNWDADSFLASINLEHMGKVFDISSMYDGATHRTLEISDGTKLTETTEITERLASYFDPALCKASIISFQNEADIVSAKPAARRDSLRKIYNLEFSNQITSIDIEIKKLKDIDLRIIENTILVLSSKDYDFQDLDRPPCSKEKYEFYQERLKVLKALFDQYDQKIEGLRVRKIEKSGIEKEVIKLRNSISPIQNNIEDNRKSIIENNIKLGDALYTERNTLQTKLETYDFEVALRLVQEKIDALSEDKRIPQLAFDLVEEAKELQNLSVLTIQASNKLEAIKSGKCPTCSAEYNSDDIELVGTILETAKIKHSDFEKIYNEHVEESNKRDKIIKDQADLDTRRLAFKTEYDSEIEKVIVQKEHLETSITRENDSISEKEKLIQANIESANTAIASYETRISEIAITVIDMTAKAVEIDTKDIDPINEDDKTEAKVIDDKIIRYVKITNQNEIYEKQNTKLKEQQITDKELLVDTQTELVDLKSKISIKERSISILKKEFPNYVINNTIGGIELGANNFLKKAYDGRYNIKVKETKTGIQIVYGSKDKDIRLSSGGEQDLFNLGLKHGFSQITGLGILVLDEVDKFLDITTGRYMFSVVNDLLCDKKSGINQVIAISHNEEIRTLLMTDFNSKVFRVKGGLVIEE